MFARRPARHVEPDLTDHLQGGSRINPINLCQVDPGHRVEIRVDVKAWRLPLARAPFAGRRRLRQFDFHVCHKRLETRVNLLLTRLQLLLQKRILLQGLLSRKEMLSPPVPFQGLGDRRLIVFAPPIAVAGQTLRIALACQNGTENRHPRLAVDSADDLRQFEVHLLQGFLPMLDSPRGHGHQHPPLPQVTTQHLVSGHIY